MNELLYTSASESIFVFPREYLQAAMLVSLLSVWVLVGLFFYLNRYTRRPYFKASNQLVSSGFFISAVLQLFIAVSMIILALEEARASHERVLLQLRQAEKLSALGRMISGVAHELNNPLAVINGYLELLLRRRELKKSIWPELEKVARESDRAAKLVGQFLSFARKQRPCQEPVQLNTLIRQLAESQPILQPATPLDLQLDLDPHLPLISGDPDQIHQVLANLVTNAIQAMAHQPRPRLWLKSERRSSQVRVMVEDNGPGIAADIVPHIFEPFFTTKEVGSGTGLGLSIAHSIIRRHGGRI